MINIGFSVEILGDLSGSGAWLLGKQQSGAVYFLELL